MPSHHDLAIVINTNLDVGGPCSRGGVCFYGPQNEQMLEELRTCWKGNKNQKKSSKHQLKNTYSVSIACPCVVLCGIFLYPSKKKVCQRGVPWFDPKWSAKDFRLQFKRKVQNNWGILIPLGHTRIYQKKRKNIWFLVSCSDFISPWDSDKTLSEEMLDSSWGTWLLGELGELGELTLEWLGFSATMISVTSGTLFFSLFSFFSFFLSGSKKLNNSSILWLAWMIWLQADTQSLLAPTKMSAVTSKMTPKMSETSLSSSSSTCSLSEAPQLSRILCAFSSIDSICCHTSSRAFWCWIWHSHLSASSRISLKHLIQVFCGEVTPARQAWAKRSSSILQVAAMIALQCFTQ